MGVRFILEYHFCQASDYFTFDTDTRHGRLIEPRLCNNAACIGNIRSVAVACSLTDSVKAALA